MRDPRVAASLVMLLALSGCQRVVFDAPPADASCDSALAGHWESFDADAGADARADLLLDIAGDCSLRAWNNEQDPKRPLEPAQLHAALVQDQQMLWVDAGWVHRAFDMRTGPLDDRAGVYVLAYRLSDDMLEMRHASAKALAPRVLADEIDGSVLKQDSDLTVRVGGDAANTRKALATPGAFDSRDPMRFRRTQSDDAASQP